MNRLQVPLDLVMSRKGKCMLALLGAIVVTVMCVNSRLMYIHIVHFANIYTGDYATFDPLRLDGDDERGIVPKRVVNVATRGCIGKGFKKHLPRALIIGVSKCGTAALGFFLSLHPGISMAGGNDRGNDAETHYFDWHYNKGDEWYRNLMACTRANAVTIERTPRYFIHYNSIKRIHTFNPDMKLILMVRDPVERVISHLAHDLAWGNPDVASKLINGTGQVDISLHQIYSSLYVSFLPLWMEYFTLSDQILILDHHELQTSPMTVIRKVENFLGLEHNVTDDQIFFNPTKGFFCKRPDPTLSDGYICMDSAKGRRHRDLPAETIAVLGDFYRPANREFFQLTGQDFGWPI